MCVKTKTFLFMFLAGYAVRCDDSNYYVVRMPDSVPTKDFKVYWNVPTMQCKSKKIYFDDLYENYGILQNAGDTFRGDRISILYDPGEFPALFRNDSSSEIRYRNGGVPQEGDLIKHLDSFQKVMEQSIPDKEFNGVGIIDFESWRPILRQNFGSLTPYKDVSYEIEKKRFWWWKKTWIQEEAKRRFELAGRDFMQATISLAKSMRPHAAWGYYGFPYCFNMAANRRTESCAEKVPQENDRISWLWKESTALYPSVYSSADITSSQLAALIRGRVKEAARVTVKNAPILPYFWFRYINKDYFSKKDLNVALSTFYKSNASGFIIWGSSNDVNTVEKCKKLKTYVTNILGPAVAKYTKTPTKLEDEPDETYNVILKPTNESIYDPEYTWIPPENYTQSIEKMVDKELKEEKEASIAVKDIKESILVDMILHKIANYCADGCDSRNKERRTEEKNEKENITSESRIVLVTEDPFRRNFSKIAITVPTTTEDDILYDYNLNTGGVTLRDFYENDYIDTSTVRKNMEQKDPVGTSTEETTTIDFSDEESSTITLSTTETSGFSETSDTSEFSGTSGITETSDTSESNETSGISETSDTSETSTTGETSETSVTVETSETSLSTDQTNGYIQVETSTIDLDKDESSTIDSSTVESTTDDFWSITDYFSTMFSTTEETTDDTNSTNTDISTTMAPVLTEQVVVSVV